MAAHSTRYRWREPLIDYPKGAKPANFAIIEQRRQLFGSGAHPQCTANARSTGLRCLNPAVHGAKCCRLHGGLKWAVEAAKAQDARVVLVKSDHRISSRFYAAVATSSDEVLAEMPSTMKQKALSGSLRARGRKIEEFLNTGRIKDDE